MFHYTHCKYYQFRNNLFILFCQVIFWRKWQNHLYFQYFRSWYHDFKFHLYKVFLHYLTQTHVRKGYSIKRSMYNKFFQIILWVILKWKVYINMASPIFHSQDSWFWTLKEILVFPKYLEYRLLNFIVIWQSYLWLYDTNWALTGLRLLHPVVSQAATEQIFSTKNVRYWLLCNFFVLLELSKEK